MQLSFLIRLVLLFLLVICVYLVFTNNVQGRMKLIVIVFCVVIGLYLYSKLKLFKDYNEYYPTPESAKEEYTINKDLLKKSDGQFTISVWVFIDDWNYKYGEPKIVLGRMDTEKDPQFGIVLAPMQNDLNINIETYPSSDNSSTSSHTCNVQNIPLQKWVHCLVSVYGKSMDVYIDGKLVRTCILPGVAKINNDTDLSITPLGGFSGLTSNFQFIPNATNPQEAYNIYKKGYGGSALGNLFNKYRIKFVFLVDNKDQGSFEI